MRFFNRFLPCRHGSLIPRSILLCVIAYILFIASSHPQDFKRTKEDESLFEVKFEEGVDSYKDENYYQAKEVFKEAADIDPDNKEVKIYLRQAERKIKQDEQKEGIEGEEQKPGKKAWSWFGFLKKDSMKTEGEVRTADDKDKAAAEEKVSLEEESIDVDSGEDGWASETEHTGDEDIQEQKFVETEDRVTEDAPVMEQADEKDPKKGWSFFGLFGKKQGKVKKIEKKTEEAEEDDDYYEDDEKEESKDLEKKKPVIRQIKIEKKEIKDSPDLKEQKPEKKSRSFFNLFKGKEQDKSLNAQEEVKQEDTAKTEKKPWSFWNIFGGRQEYISEPKKKPEKIVLGTEPWFFFRVKKKAIRELVDEIPVKGLKKKLTIEECVDIGLKNNISLSVAAKQVKLAKIRIWEAQRDLGPSLKGKWEETGGTINERYYIGRTISSEMTQTLFDGGEISFTVEQAKINLKIVQNDYEKIRNGFVLVIEKAYYSLDKSIKALELQDGLKKDVEKISAISKREYDMGVVHRVEYLNVAAKRNQIDFQHISAKEDVQLALLILQQAMNTEEDFDIYPVGQPEVNKNISLKSCYDLAFSNRPEMKVNFLMVEYYLYEKKIMNAHGWPKVDFIGQWGHQFEDFIPKDNPEQHISHKFRPEWYAGVKVKVPMRGSTLTYSFTKEQWRPVVSAFLGTTSSTHLYEFDVANDIDFFTNLAESDIGFDKSQEEYYKTKKEIYLEVQEAFFKYKKALLQAKVAESKVKFQSQQLNLTQIKRSLNEAPSSGVIDDLIKMSEETFGLFQSYTDYYIALSMLNKAIGIIGYF